MVFSIYLIRYSLHSITRAILALCRCNNSLNKAVERLRNRSGGPNPAAFLGLAGFKLRVPFYENIVFCLGKTIPGGRLID